MQAAAGTLQCNNACVRCASGHGKTRCSPCHGAHQGSRVPGWQALWDWPDNGGPVHWLGRHRLVFIQRFPLIFQGVPEAPLRLLKLAAEVGVILASRLPEAPVADVKGDQLLLLRKLMGPANLRCSWALGAMLSATKVLCTCTHTKKDDWATYCCKLEAGT